MVKLLVQLGTACEEYQRRTLRGLRCEDVQVDEIWAFVGCKQGHLPEGEDSDRGDEYTFFAIDRATKLVPCFLTGRRATAWSFLRLTSIIAGAAPSGSARVQPLGKVDRARRPM